MSFAARGFLAVFAMVPFTTVLRAQTIEIKFVNGKTGGLITDRSEWSIWVGESARLIVPTHKDGVARLRLTQNDKEINVPQCEGEKADFQKVNDMKGNKKEYKKKLAEFNRKYRDCGYFDVENPVARYADTLTFLATPGDVSWKGTPRGVPYVTCWVNTNEVKYSWMIPTNFSTKDVLEKGVVTTNTCDSATATPQPGQLILFVRSPNIGEQWRQAVN